MKIIYKYYKNSNTGEVIKSKKFTETGITGMPVYFYNLQGELIGENLDVTGFVEMSEKKYNRLERKIKKQ